jgi:hypothetical protein
MDIVQKTKRRNGRCVSRAGPFESFVSFVSFERTA